MRFDLLHRASVYIVLEYPLPCLQGRWPPSEPLGLVPRILHHFHLKSTSQAMVIAHVVFGCFCCMTSPCFVNVSSTSSH
ncbi:hypothetical protein HZ326_12265 [Fusarium oxysporum f. sp. albedinis]|nr:hypothetical protein HZ326_12265 [Fusarium oxysporum f. sp. albedinis]